MRKRTWMLRGVMVIAMASFCIAMLGCKKEEERRVVIGQKQEGTVQSDSNSDDKTGIKEGFTFEYRNVKITPNDLMEPLVTALGSEYTYYESPSCAYIGLDKCYVYQGFSIYTYPDEKAADHVLQIVLTDDSLCTPEGLQIGDTEEKVKELYGKDYKESEGSFAYVKGSTELRIIMREGRVYSIQYCYQDSVG